MSYGAVIYRLGPDVDRAIMDTINECLQWRDFPMFNPLDDRGNSVSELYRYWLGRKLEEGRVLFFNPRGIVPPCLELELTISGALLDFEYDLLNAVQVPPEFGLAAAETGFDIEIIGPGNIVLKICGSRVEQRDNIRARLPRRTTY